MMEPQARASTEPRVTICLLTYNHAHALTKVLESVMALVAPDTELVVSDDCSTDGTWELVDMCIAGCTRARAVRTPSNRGMPGNANYAFAQARGEFVALLHHDDLVSPDLVRKWLAIAEIDPEIGFVFNDYDIGGIAGHATEGRNFEAIMDGRRFLEEHLLSGWGCPVRGTALIRRRCLEAIGGMDGRYGLVADIDLWMRLASQWKVGYVAEPLITVRHDRPRDYPKEYTRFSWRRLAFVYRIHANNLASLGERTGWQRRLKWWAFRTRVSVESAKWLGYGLMRGKPEMLAQAAEGANEYEWLPVRVVRAICARTFDGMRRVGSGDGI